MWWSEQNRLKWIGPEAAVGGEGGDADGEQGVGGVEAGDFNGQEVVGEGGGMAAGNQIGRGVERDGWERLPEELTAVGEREFVGERAEAGHALVDDRRGDGAGGVESLAGSSRTWGKGKEMEIAERERAEEGTGFFEFGVGFAGKASHDIGAEGERGAGGAQESFDFFGVVPGAVAAVHTAEHGVGTGLERQMDVAGHARGGAELGEQGDEVRVPVHGLDGAKAETGQSGFGKDLADERGESSAGGQGREVAAPAAKVDAGEDQLVASGGDETADLLQDRCVGQAAGGTACKGNDAEGTAVGAAFLNFEVGPGLRAGSDLLLFEEGVSEAVVEHLRHLRWGRFMVESRCRNDLDQLGGVEGLSRIEEAGDQFGSEGLVAVAHDGCDAGQGGQLGRSALGVAASDDDAGLGIAAVCAADKGACGAVGFGGYAAGVDDDDLGIGGVLQRVAAGAQMSGDGFAIGTRGSAAEVMNVKIRHKLSLVPTVG
jgi:hypothetical protein